MTSPSMVNGSIAGSVLPLRRAEELIATLPGVLSVRIVPGDSGAVEEIHVLTTDQVAPKNTVRNIESALMAQLGLRVNHKKISIATTLDAPRVLDEGNGGYPTPMMGLSAIPGGAPPMATPLGTPAIGAFQTPYAGMGAVPSPAAPALPADGYPVPPVSQPVAQPVSPMFSAPSMAVGGTPQGAGPSGATRRSAEVQAARRMLLFEDVEVRRSRMRGVTCRVTLSREGVEHFGEAEGQESDKARIELAARATLQAIASALRTTAGERSLALEGAKQIDAFDREYVLVSLVARVGRETVVLTGTCEVREGVETGAVLAVLDATNRWIHVDR